MGLRVFAGGAEQAAYGLDDPFRRRGVGQGGDQGAVRADDVGDGRMIDNVVAVGIGFLPGVAEIGRASCRERV